MNHKEKFSLKEKLLADYNMSNDKDYISGERIASRLDQLSKINLTEHFGSNRPGYSKGEQEAKKLVAKWMEEAGLTVEFDGAGNVIGRLAGENDELPAILTGSHVDSVPNGGHFDGVLGVISALEVVEAWKTANYTPKKPLEIIVFADEEGARFNSGLTGSEAMMNTYDIEQRLQMKDTSGKSFTEVLADQGLSLESYQAAARDVSKMELFVELHIEQGARLEEKNLPVGIVSGIAGPSWIQFTFSGKADHAGNTPMLDRQDALVAASEFIQKVSELPGQISDSAVATVGKLTVSPNGVNVIPGEVDLYVDIRDIYEDSRDELIDRIIETSKEVAKTHHVKVKHIENTRVKPIPIAQELQNLLAETLRSFDIEPTYVPSGAGHDAMVLGLKVPVAMIFVRSKEGISHHPDEWTSLKDCVIGARVLKAFLEKLQTK